MIGFGNDCRGGKAESSRFDVKATSHSDGPVSRTDHQTPRGILSMRLNSKSWAIALLSTAVVLATDLLPTLHLGGAPAMARPGGGAGDHGAGHGSGHGLGGASAGTGSNAGGDVMGRSATGTPDVSGARSNGANALAGTGASGLGGSNPGRTPGCCGALGRHSPFRP